MYLCRYVIQYELSFENSAICLPWGISYHIIFRSCCLSCIALNFVIVRTVNHRSRIAFTFLEDIILEHESELKSRVGGKLWRHCLHLNTSDPSPGLSKRSFAHYYKFSSFSKPFEYPKWQKGVECRLEQSLNL